MSTTARPPSHLDAAKCMPLIGSMLAQQARQELEKGCELFPEMVKAKVRKLYEHADAKGKSLELLTLATNVAPRVA
jgi:hypothetical protein